MISIVQRRRWRQSIGRRGARPGFTLLELLVVLVIIGLLAGLVAPRVFQYLSRAKTETAQTQLRNIAAALDLYRLDLGRYPAQNDGLDALVSAPAGAAGWDGPYLQNAKGILDPWNEEYQYRVPGEHGEYDLFSYGADKALGGESDDQDVVSW